MNRLSCSALLAAIALLTPVAASALSLEIRAGFRPEPGNPGGSFVNQTPNSGYCQTNPGTCASQGKASLNVPLTTAGVTLPANTPASAGAMLRVTADEKIVTVTSATGTSASVGFQVTDFGAQYATASDVERLTGNADEGAHYYLWDGGHWRFPPAGCTGSGTGVYTPYSAVFFWGNPTGAACGKSSFFPLDDFRFNQFNVAYKLSTPTPIGMPSGTYTGSVTYSVGPGGDIDFGPLLVASDDSVTFNFVLEVSHDLQIRVTPGEESLTLTPPGGWSRSMGRHRAPDRLTARQNFEISSSADFSVQLRCDYRIGSQCAIANAAGEQVAVDTRLTLPVGFTVRGGPVNGHALSALSAEPVSLTAYVSGGRASLDFEVGSAGAAEMFSRPGITYSGDVTVIWDSVI